MWDLAPGGVDETFVLPWRSRDNWCPLDDEHGAQLSHVTGGSGAVAGRPAGSGSMPDAPE